MMHWKPIGVSAMYKRSQRSFRLQGSAVTGLHWMNVGTSAAHACCSAMQLMSMQSMHACDGNSPWQKLAPHSAMQPPQAQACRSWKIDADEGLPAVQRALASA